MRSHITKRSIVIAGHKTSVSIEDQFWWALKDIACGQQSSLSKIVEEIKTRRPGNLSSGIRLYVLDSLRTQLRGYSGDRFSAIAMGHHNGAHPA